MLILSGKSTSGKDSIVNKLIEKGYKKMITYTNRPMREGEVADVTYHYVTTEEFLKRYIDGFFLEVKYYTTEFGLWFYGSAIEDYEKADDDTVCILTPSGLRKLNDNLIPHTTFFISVSDETIKKRQVLRGDNKEEADRRFEADKKDFCNCDHLFDFVINNDNRDLNKIVEYIDIIYRGVINK